jgi:flagellar biosynthesis chaperone FliJ
MLLDAERRARLAEDQVELCRRALVLADQKVKSLENLEEQDRSAFIQRQEQKDSREREDNWLSINAYQR